MLLFFLYVIAIAICFVIVAKLYNKISIIRNLLFVIILVGGVVLYYPAYLLEAIPNEETFRVFLRSFQSAWMTIILEPNYAVVEKFIENPYYYWTFNILNVFCILFLSLATVSIFARKFFSWLQLALNMYKKTYIFAQITEQALILARDILAKNPKSNVIFIGDADTESSVVNEITQNKMIYLEQKANKKSILHSSLLKINYTLNITNIFFMSPSEDENIFSTFSFVESLSEKLVKSSKEQIHLFVKIESDNLQQVFEEQFNKKGKNIEYSVFSEGELIAFDLIQKYPATDYIAINTEKCIATENYEVLFLGFGRNGISMLRRIIEQSQFVGSNFKATVVDSALDDIEGSFLTTYPAIKENYSLSFIAESVTSTHFFDSLKKESKSLKQIIISLGNDEFNVKTAIEVFTFLQQINKETIDILVVVNKPNQFTYLHDSTVYNSIRFIGQQDIIYTEDIIVKEAISQKAKAVHTSYCKGKTDVPKWSHLSYIKKTSNISVALHIKVKLALLGLSKNLDTFSSAEDFKRYLNEHKEKLENLAKTEKLRWNALYFTQGWQKWYLEDIPKNNENGQDGIKKLHACLVSWEELAAVDKHFNQEVGTYQSYDVNNILELYSDEKL